MIIQLILPVFHQSVFLQKMRCSPGSLSVLDMDLYDIGPEQVKTFANKHKAFVTAGVDATLLQNGPVEAIVERIKFYIDKMASEFVLEVPIDCVSRASKALTLIGKADGL